MKRFFAAIILACSALIANAADINGNYYVVVDTSMTKAGDFAIEPFSNSAAPQPGECDKSARSLHNGQIGVVCTTLSLYPTFDSSKSANYKVRILRNDDMYTLSNDFVGSAVNTYVSFNKVGRLEANTTLYNIRDQPIDANNSVVTQQLLTKDPSLNKDVLILYTPYDATRMFLTCHVRPAGELAKTNLKDPKVVDNYRNSPNACPGADGKAKMFTASFM